MTDLELLKAFCEGGKSYFEQKFSLNEYDRGFYDALNMIIDQIEFHIELKKEMNN